MRGFSTALPIGRRKRDLALAPDVGHNPVQRLGVGRREPEGDEGLIRSGLHSQVTNRILDGHDVRRVLLCLTMHLD